MNIRCFEQSDFAALKELHEHFYKDEFDVTELFRNPVCLYVVEDDNEVICIGGVRTIAESVLLTNKDTNPRLKRAALFTLLQASVFTCQQFNYHQLHAFVQGDEWTRILKNKKVGFAPAKGEVLVLTF